MIDTGSSGCLLRESAAVRCGGEVLEDATALYGFGSQGVPAARAIGRCRADLLIDGVVGKNIQVLVVPDEAQSVDLLVGRTFTELPYVTYARLGGSLQFWHRDECPFSHLEPFVSCPKLRLKTAEETPLQANVINWVRLSSKSNVTGAVLFNNCGCEILVDMEDGKVTVPVFTSGNDDVVHVKDKDLATRQRWTSRVAR
uniref:Putative e3 ubiquitin ligase n=1 Tax=Rhipicephalus microplus TaxID=6941 RepID=A0A6G5ABX7_RHIMP